MKTLFAFLAAAVCAGGVCAAPLWSPDNAPGGLHGVKNPGAEFSFTVQRPPAFGAEFAFLLTDATQTGPQAAVFLNGMLQGIVQLWGTSPTQTAYKWRKTYRLYLPPNAFKSGANTLAVRLVPPMWSDPVPEVMGRFWLTWENLRVEALDAAPREPVHGKPFWLGTTIKPGTGFRIDQRAVDLIGIALPWIGVAYCGNTMRADFWYDVSHDQPMRREYLEKLRAYNASVLVDYIGGHFRIDATGELDPKGKAALAAFFEDYGNLIHYYELGNEPCMFWGAYADYLATARHLYANRPPHLLLAATGWAYGGGKGEPVNWDADPVRRRAVEAWCDTLNGHAYGNSYNDARGGSFFETFKTHGQPADGWPKPFIVSETGANDWHSEENGPRYPSRAPHISAFDRILRAHIAVADRTMQHSLIFDDFGLLDAATDPNDMRRTLRARPGVNGEPPRLSAFRRLALAYATHGAPLETEILNAAELQNRLVLARAVDTLALAPLAGSLAASDKILVCLINFEDTPQKISARVKMPAAGGYAALRIGDGPDYASAHAQAPGPRNASPWLAFADTLAPGEGVQYILTPTAQRPRPAAWNVPEKPPRRVYEPPAAPPLAAPSGIRANGLGNRVVVDYLETEGAVFYELERAEGNGAFAPVGKPTGRLAIVDANLDPGAYAYRVRAHGEAQAGPYSETVRVTLDPGAAPAGWTDSSIGSNNNAGKSLSNADGTLMSVTGAGHDIWGGKDGLRFLNKKISGDATLVVRVLHADTTHEYMKVGLMARAGLGEGAPFALIAQSTGSCMFNWRTAEGGECGQHGAHRQPWLKLERRGTALTGYASPDGTLWNKVAEAALPAGELLIGLAVCSHNQQTATALFDNISLVTAK